MLLPLQGVNAMAIRNPGCRFACPGLCAVALSGRAFLVAKPCRKKIKDFEHPTLGVTHFILPLSTKTPMTETDEGTKRAHPKGVRPNMIVS